MTPALQDPNSITRPDSCAGSQRKIETEKWTQRDRDRKIDRDRQRKRGRDK